jgi:hypothetical protein
MIVAVSENFCFFWKIIRFIQGETIEAWLGAAFCLSTMAGNANKIINNINI